MTAGDECSAELASVSRKPSPLKQDRQKTITAITKKMGKGKRHANIKKSYEKKPNRRARFRQFYRNSARNNWIL